MKHRVLRGGSYFSVSRYLRTPDRYWLNPNGRYRILGFRLVLIRRKL